MLILGIESSCDDTSVALVNCSESGHVVIAEKTASQIDIHKKYGGVVPEIAGRMHAEKIVPLIEAVLAGQPKPDAIAVTAGPGLVTGLIVGVEAAKTLSFAWNIPLVAVNHLSGHIHSVELSPQTTIQFPALALIVSGGHTELARLKSHTDFKILGSTKDDAAGECFDKVAKLLGLPYPGGPQISKLASEGRTDAIEFPRPMLREDNFDFSFAGLKTSALYWMRDNSLVIPTEARSRAEVSRSLLGESLISKRDSSTPPPIGGSAQNDSAHVTTNDFCASFEQAIVEVLVAKTLRAAEEIKPTTLILGGGVAANKKLRTTLSEAVAAMLPNTKMLIPSLPYCMDNGAMIAVAGFYQALQKKFSSWENLSVNPVWHVDEPNILIR